MKAIITTKNEQTEIDLQVPEPFSLIPKGESIVSFIAGLKIGTVHVELIGTCPYKSKDKK